MGIASTGRAIVRAAFAGVFVGLASWFYLSVVSPPAPPQIPAADGDAALAEELAIARRLGFVEQSRAHVSTTRDLPVPLGPSECVAVVGVVRGIRAELFLSLQGSGTTVATSGLALGLVAQQAQWCAPPAGAPDLVARVSLRPVFLDRDGDAHAADVVVLRAPVATVGGLERLNQGYVTTEGVGVARPPAVDPTGVPVTLGRFVARVPAHTGLAPVGRATILPPWVAGSRGAVRATMPSGEQYVVEAFDTTELATTPLPAGAAAASCDDCEAPRAPEAVPDGPQRAAILWAPSHISGVVLFAESRGTFARLEISCDGDHCRDAEQLVRFAARTFTSTAPAPDPAGPRIVQLGVHSVAIDVPAGLLLSYAEVNDTEGYTLVAPSDPAAPRAPYATAYLVDPEPLTAEPGTTARTFTLQGRPLRAFVGPDSLIARTPFGRDASLELTVVAPPGAERDRLLHALAAAPPGPLAAP